MSDTTSPPSNYYDHPKSGEACGATNVGDNERVLSIVGGATLAVLGVRHGGLGGLIAFAAGGALAYRGISGHCGLYDKLGVSSAKPAPPERYFKHGIHVDVSITIDKPADELYNFWRSFENLPQIMSHLQSVKVHDDKRSTWTAKGPAGTSPTWDAEIINEEPSRLIAWRSLGGATVDNAGSVRFIPAPAGRGTEVRGVLDYVPPGRTLGMLFAKLFGEEPQRQIETDLRRFKQLMETGEITTSQSTTANEPDEQ
jgi:uncharacterized membrane protein